jgi:hypothetical protein
MDSVLKSRYDFYRGKGELPPEVAVLIKEGVGPFTDMARLNSWRNYSSDLRVVSSDGYELAGKLDEIMLEADGRLIPTDFKSSGYAPKVDKQKYYVSQLNSYALLLQGGGNQVSDRAILVHYFLKDTANPSLLVEFVAHVDPVRLDIEAFRDKLKAMVELLNAPYPGDNTSCPTCTYYKGREGAIL